jgi:hypothetical protein
MVLKSSSSFFFFLNSKGKRKGTLNHPIESNLDKPILSIASFNHCYATIYLKSKLSAENYNSLVFVYSMNKFKNSPLPAPPRGEDLERSFLTINWSWSRKQVIAWRHQI